jgi:peroxiredoxin
MQVIVSRAIASLCLIAGIGLLLVMGLPQHSDYNGFVTQSRGYVAPEIGQHAPPFTLSNLKLETVSLSDFEDQVIIINFWATWCVPCQLEMQTLQDIYTTNTSNLAIIGINLGESPQAVAQWVGDYGLTYDILLDPLETTVHTYQIRGQPSTYVVDPDGVIQQIYYGAVNADQLEANISTLQPTH